MNANLILVTLVLVLTSWTCGAVDDCLCHVYLEPDTEQRNLVFSRGYQLHNFCQADGEAFCVLFCKIRFLALTEGGDLTVPAQPYGKTFGHAACSFLARDVVNKTLQVYAQSCGGYMIPTGLVSKQPLCCRGEEYYDC